jgi:hypothetical protein
METTTFSKTNEKLYETAEAANKGFNQINSTIMDVYSKQLNLVSGFYNNLFNSFPWANKNVWNANMDFTKYFGADETFKLFTPFNWFKTSDYLGNFFKPQSEDLFKKTIEFNNNWFAELQKQFKIVQMNWVELSEKMQEIAEEEWKATYSSINSLIEAYNKQADFSIESNRKFMEKINSQFDLAAKQSEKFWSDVLKTVHPADKTEKENEQLQTLPKKQNKAEFATAHNNKH